MHYCLIEEKLGETKIIKGKDVRAFSVQRTRLYRSLEQAIDHAGRKRLTRERSRKKMECSDFSAFDSVALMTPLTTPMLMFTRFICALTTPLMTPTLSLVKASLNSTS